MMTLTRSKSLLSLLSAGVLGCCSLGAQARPVFVNSGGNIGATYLGGGCQSGGAPGASGCSGPYTVPPVTDSFNANGVLDTFFAAVAGPFSIGSTYPTTDAQGQPATGYLTSFEVYRDTQLAAGLSDNALFDAQFSGGSGHLTFLKSFSGSFLLQLGGTVTLDFNAPGTTSPFLEHSDWSQHYVYVVQQIAAGQSLDITLLPDTGTAIGLSNGTYSELRLTGVTLFADPAPIPEPGAAGLVAAALGVLAALRLRRRRR